MQIFVKLHYQANICLSRNRYAIISPTACPQHSQLPHSISNRPATDEHQSEPLQMGFSLRPLDGGDLRVLEMAKSGV